MSSVQKLAHERVYNVPCNLQEVSIVTNEQPHDLVIQPRGGGLQIISDLHPSSMPLHFTLLFPFGTAGWHPFIENSTTGSRVTVSQFFAYHLMVCLERTNFLHRSGRHFQEFMLNAFIKMDDQKLHFHCQN